MGSGPVGGRHDVRPQPGARPGEVFSRAGRAPADEVL